VSSEWFIQPPFRLHRTNIEVISRPDKTFNRIKGYIDLIVYKIKELIEARPLHKGRKVTLSYLAEQVGIQSSAMSKIANNKGYNTSMTTVDRLCEFFDCKIEDLVEYRPNS
jgi:putative transcriptional regulator